MIFATTLDPIFRTIRYARASPTDGIAEELLSDTFWPICSPKLLAAGLKRAADLRRHVLVHCHWGGPDPPTWQRWLGVARTKWRDVPEFNEIDHLNFWEELHAIEAVIAGQGIGILSSVLVAHELAAGTLVKAFDLSLPGLGFYVVHTPGHRREKAIRAFSKWLKSVV
jgi:LysR family glycine cleavage system transcriptional activator